MSFGNLKFCALNCNYFDKDTTVLMGKSMILLGGGGK
jgi:hypothetical protein